MELVLDQSEQGHTRESKQSLYGSYRALARDVNENKRGRLHPANTIKMDNTFFVSPLNDTIPPE